MKIHYGVGLLISNESQTQFFVQQKDETYPYKDWRGCLSFWGGAIEEEDKSPLAAVERELEEEIPASISILSPYSKKEIGTFKITYARPFFLTVFEIRIPDQKIEALSQIAVLEGDGLMLSKEEILDYKWIWETDFIFLEHILD